MNPEINNVSRDNGLGNVWTAPSSQAKVKPQTNEKSVISLSMGNPLSIIVGRNSGPNLENVQHKTTQLIKSYDKLLSLNAKMESKLSDTGLIASLKNAWTSLTKGLGEPGRIQAKTDKYIAQLETVFKEISALQKDIKDSKVTILASDDVNATLRSIGEKIKQYNTLHVGLENIDFREETASKENPKAWIENLEVKRSQLTSLARGDLLQANSQGKKEWKEHDFSIIRDSAVYRAIQEGINDRHSAIDAFIGKKT